MPPSDRVMPPILPEPPTGGSETEPSTRREQRRARSEEVRRLHREGASLRGIARALGLHYRTVERYIRSDA